MKPFRLAAYRVFRALGASWETGTVDGFTVRYSLRDQLIGSALFFDRVWEPHVGSAIRELELTGTTAIDVGAHVGIHTLQLARAVGTTGRVIALEPEKRNLAYLRRNVAANGFGNVTVIASSAGDSAGQADLAIDAENFGGHRIQPAGRLTGKPLQKVDVTTLDSLTADAPLDTIRFVKIDAEGSELAVLRGMASTIERNPGMVILLELSADSDPAATVGYLRSLGFGGWEVQRNRALPLQPSEVYERLVGDHVEIVVSRDLPTVDRLIRRAYARATSSISGARP